MKEEMMKGAFSRAVKGIQDKMNKYSSERLMEGAKKKKPGVAAMHMEIIAKGKKGKEC